VSKAPIFKKQIKNRLRSKANLFIIFSNFLRGYFFILSSEDRTLPGEV